MAAHVLVPLCYGCLDESRSTVVSQTYEEHRDLFDCTLCVAVAAVLNVAANIINREVIAPHVPEHLSGIPLLCWSILIAIAMVCFAWSGPGLVYIMEGAPSPHALECPALQPVHTNGNTIANKGGVCVCVSAFVDHNQHAYGDVHCVDCTVFRFVSFFCAVPTAYSPPFRAFLTSRTWCKGTIGHPCSWAYVALRPFLLIDSWHPCTSALRR